MTARAWLGIARRPDVVRRSLKLALVVGSILVAINHGDRIFGGGMTRLEFVKIALTYCVPYCVSTYASVAALRSATQDVE